MSPPDERDKTYARLMCMLCNKEAIRYAVRISKILQRLHHKKTNILRLHDYVERAYKNDINGYHRWDER